MQNQYIKDGSCYGDLLRPTHIPKTVNNYNYKRQSIKTQATVKIVWKERNECLRAQRKLIGVVVNKLPEEYPDLKYMKQ